MKRALVLVEGQTEETFVRDVLRPHLAIQGIHLISTIVATKRVKAGGKFRGGIISFGQFRRDLTELLRDSGAIAVTTMIDFYGLPADFPGLSTLPKRVAARERAHHVERALATHFADRRFLPYLSLHEFEALLLAGPEEVERTLGAGRIRTLGRRGIGAALSQAVAGSGSPEEVDDGEDSHPAARIQRLAPAYRKALYGPIIAKRIGLDAMRGACPHFDGWVGRLEELAGSGG